VGLKMDRILEFSKEQYAWEAQRRDKLNSSSSIPIGLATTSGAILVSALSRITHPYDRYEYFIILLLFVSMLSLLTFMYYTIRFFLGPIYKYVAESDEVVDFWKKNKEFYEKNPKLGDGESKFDQFLIETYSRCATINCRNNDQKSRRLYLMNRWVLTVLAPCLIVGLVLPIYHSLRGSAANGASSVTEQKPLSPPQPPPERSVKDGAHTKPGQVK
jgi:hypothetical protein